MRKMLGFSLDDIAKILQTKKNTVKARLQRAKAALGAYFSGRCQWAEGASDCSCESRLGFALSYAPEILQRLRNRPPDENMKKVVRTTLQKIGDIDQVYRNLPMQDYETESLQAYLRGA